MSSYGKTMGSRGERQSAAFFRAVFNGCLPLVITPLIVFSPLILVHFIGQLTGQS